MSSLVIAFPAYDVANDRRVTYETYHECDKGLRVSDVLEACVSAPTFYQPKRVVSSYQQRKPVALVDGGIFANNASSFAYNFVRHINSFRGDQNMFLLSLGTGTKGGASHSVPTCTLGWCSRFPKLCLTSESQEIADEIITMLGKRFVRIQGEVSNHSLDDCSDRRVAQLEADAAKILEINKTKLDAFCLMITEWI